MPFHINPARVLAATILILSAWIVHGFVQALLAACITAIASWPLYTWYMARLPRCLANRVGSAIFTGAITVFVLAPIVFAFVALLGQAHAMLHDAATAGGHGLVIPAWLVQQPVVEGWLSGAGRPTDPSHALQLLARHADSSALLGWAQSLGQFTIQHVLIVAFVILLLALLYEEGESLARELSGALHRAIGERGERYLEVAVCAVRSCVNSMLAVGLFDGLASALVYAASGVEHPILWGAITGVLAALPFFSYLAVAAVAVQLAVRDAPSAAMLVLLLGSAVQLVGDKLVQPMVARGGMRLPFAWVLMGSLGGFAAFGLTGLVIGPVVLTLAGELWAQRARDEAA